MTTTGFIIELLVIGVGVCFVLALIALGVSPAFAPAIDVNLVVLLGFPILCFVYVLGVVFDRLMNELFDCLKPLLFYRKADKKELNQKEKQIKEARDLILLKGEKLSELYLYAASRERICRSWSILALLIAPLIFWSGGRFLGDDYRVLISLAASFFLMLSITSFFAWYTFAKDSMVQTDKIGQNIRLLRDR